MADAYTVTAEGGLWRLRLADGRVGLFVSQADAVSEGDRLTSGRLIIAIPRPALRGQRDAAHLSRSQIAAEAAEVARQQEEAVK